MPESKRDFETLLKDYQELQLRVTQFSNIEQELINARDQLDQELVSHRRLNDFIQNALIVSSNLDFVKLVTESIIDILEIEAAVVWFSDLVENRYEIYHKEGIFLEVMEGALLRDFLMNQKETIRNEKVKIWNGKELPNGIKNTINEMIFFSFNNVDSGSSFFVTGLNTKQNAPFYKPIELRQATIFSLFSQQVKSIYLNRLKSDKIQEQIDFISKSELELRKLSLIATKTKNGVIISDNQGRIEWVNDAFTLITGYSLDEVKGKKPKDFLQSEHSDPNSLQLLKEALELKKPIEVSIANLTKDKQVYINQLEIIPVFDEHGSHTNFIALQKDITSETASREELVRVNSRFELITESSKIGIWENDFKMNRITWNETLYEQYDLSKDANEDLYHFWMSSIHEEDRNLVMEYTHKINSKEIDLVEQEYRIQVISTGQIKYLSCLTIAEKDEFGSLIRIVGSSIDITERKKNDEIIAKQNESLKQNLIEIETGKKEIEQINQNLEKLIQNATKKNLQLAKSISDQEKLVTIGEIASGVAHDLNTPLGAIKIGAESIEYSLEKLFTETIGKCNEEQISFAFEYAKNNEIGLFTGGLQLRREIQSFKEFLNVKVPQINEKERIGFSELFVKCNFKTDEIELISNIIEDPNGKQVLSLINQMQLIRSFLKTIVNSEEKSAKIIQDMKSFVKDQKNYGLTKINLNSNISSVLNIFNYEIQKNCTLKFEVDSKWIVEGYEIKLFQLWSNILKNAIDAIEDSGKQGEISIFSEEKQDSVRIVLQNNGPKIPDVVLSKMFAKFYTTKAHKNGSGIGLSIVKKIIDEHKATIDIESNEAFTRFIIDFPKIKN
jgi:PAS domain S-box-containing protein